MLRITKKADLFYKISRELTDFSDEIIDLYKFAFDKLFNTDFNYELVKKWLIVNEHLDFTKSNPQNIFKGSINHINGKDNVVIVDYNSYYIILTSSKKFEFLLKENSIKYTEYSSKNLHEMDGLKIYKLSTDVFDKISFLLEKFREYEIDELYLDPKYKYFEYLFALRKPPFRFEKKEVINFIDNNRPFLSKLRERWFSYDPRVIGYGGEGIVFDIAKDKVLKISDSVKSTKPLVDGFNRAFTSKNKNEFAIENEVTIYDNDVISLGDKQIAFIVMEKINTELSKTELNGISFSRLIHNIINNIKYYTLSKRDEILNAFEGSSEEEKTKLFNLLLNIIKNNPNISYVQDIIDNDYGDKLNTRWFERFVKQIIWQEYQAIKNNLDFEFSERNFGIDKEGFIKIFDPYVLYGS